MKLLIPIIIILVSVSVLFTTVYSETLNYSISGNYHDYTLELILSDGTVKGTITSNEKTYNLDNSKIIFRNSGFLIIDKANDLKIISKNINDDTHLVIVKIKPDIRLKFITTVDIINKNIGQRDLFAAMETVLDESELSFKELEYLQKSILTEEAQQQYEEDLDNLIYCSFDGNECLTSDEILANVADAQIITGMELIVEEETIPEIITVVDSRILYVLTSHYETVSNNSEIFKFAVKTFDKNVYSGTEWDKFDGKIDGVLVTAKIKDDTGIVKQEYSGETEYGIFEGEETINGKLIYPQGNYSLEIELVFNEQKFSETLYFVIYDDDDDSSSTFNNTPITNAGDDQHLPSGSVVTLDGSNSSDQDDSILYYTWSQIDGEDVTLSSYDVVNPTFTMPDGVNTLIFNLLVDDGQKDSDASDNVTITSLHSDAGLDQAIGLILVTLDGSGSGDALSHSTTYDWSVITVPGSSGITTGDLSNTAIVNPTFTPDEIGEYILQLDFSDGTLTDIDTVTITVS